MSAIRNARLPDGSRRFRYLKSRSLDGVAFTAQPQTPVFWLVRASEIGACLSLGQNDVYRMMRAIESE